MDNATKEKILDRLHETAAVCMTCGKRKCPHGGNTTLPETLGTDTVLRAINLDEYFFKEVVPNDEAVRQLAAHQTNNDN